MFCIKLCFLEPAGRSQDLIGGAGAEDKWLRSSTLKKKNYTNKCSTKSFKMTLKNY